MRRFPLMLQSLSLVVVGLIVAIVEWSTSKPAWPRLVKLACASAIFAIGLYGTFEGYFDRRYGISLYEKGDYVAAISELSKADASPFRNRQALDYLGLAYKLLGDRTPQAVVADGYYAKALNALQQSAAAYPRSPYAVNNMVNIYRHAKNWHVLGTLAESFANQLAANEYFLDDNSRTLSAPMKARFLVTLGNVYAELDYPKHSDSVAVGFYRKALALDPRNSDAIVNLPPRLLNIAQHTSDRGKKRELLQEALDLGASGLKLSDSGDRAFSALSIIEVLCSPTSSTINTRGLRLHETVSLLEGDKDMDPFAHFVDAESWLVLADAYVALNERSNAVVSLRRALVYQGRFTEEQKKWATRLREELE